MTNRLVDAVNDKFGGSCANIEHDDVVTLQLILMLFMKVDVNDFKAAVEIFKKTNVAPNYDHLLLQCCATTEHIFNSHIDYLISEGANVNAVGIDDISCLHRLAWCGNLEYVNKFVEYGADILHRDRDMRDVYAFLDDYLADNGISQSDENSDDEEILDESTDGKVHKNALRQSVENVRIFIRQKEIDLIAKFRDIEKKYHVLTKMIDGKGISVEI